MARAPIDDNHGRGLIVRDELSGPALDVTGVSLTNANAIHVAIVDGSGNQVTSFGGSGGTSATDDSAFTAASGSGTPIMGFVTSDSVDSGDVGVLGMLANRQLKVTLFDSGGSELSVGGGTQYTEDAAAAANPIGNALNLVRDDARGGSLTTTDGDNVAARGTNAGELYVKHVDSVAVTNAGLTELAAAINASSQMDVNIAASGATVPVSNAGLTELAAAVNGSSQVDVNIAASGATVPVSHAALTELAAAIDTEVQVDVVGALPAGDNNIGNVDLASAIPAGTNNIGDVDVLTVPADPFGANADAASATGSISAKLRFIASTGIPITGTVTVGSHAVTNAGTFAVQDSTTQTNTGNAATSLAVMDDWDNAASDGASVSGDVAHDAADAGEPVKIGAKAYSPDGTTPGTAVAENDRTNLKTDLDGSLFVRTTPATRGHKHLDGSSAYTDESIVADPGDGFQVVITNIIASTGAATALNFFLEEGSTKVFGPIYLEAVAGRGFASGPIHLPITASTAVTLTSSAAIAQSFDIDYYIQAV